MNIQRAHAPLSSTCTCMRYNDSMRTTVEMTPEHRSALLSLAARRGQKGFSSVLAEAIEEYLNGDRIRESRRQELLSLSGSIPAEDAEHLRRTAQSLREKWR